MFREIHLLLITFSITLLSCGSGEVSKDAALKNSTLSEEQTIIAAAGLKGFTKESIADLGIFDSITFMDNIEEIATNNLEQGVSVSSLSDVCGKGYVTLSIKADATVGKSDGTNVDVSMKLDFSKCEITGYTYCDMHMSGLYNSYALVYDGSITVSATVSGSDSDMKIDANVSGDLDITINNEQEKCLIALGYKMDGKNIEQPYALLCGHDPIKIINSIDNYCRSTEY